MHHVYLTIASIVIGTGCLDTAPPSPYSNFSTVQMSEFQSDYESFTCTYSIKFPRNCMLVDPGVQYNL